MKVHPAAVLILIAAAASLLVLQGIFDRADLEKGERLVREYRIGGPALGNFIEGQHADRSGPTRWSAEIVSGCRGVVRVSCAVPRPTGDALYRFDVDLPQKAIHPGDEPGKNALQALERASAHRSGP